MDVSEPLDWSRVEYTPLVAIQLYETMDGVSELVKPLADQRDTPSPGRPMRLLSHSSTYVRPSYSLSTET